jgi:carbamoyltransferase
MIILGVNSVFHESSAAIVVNGRVVASAEEERFNRRKHAKPADVDNADVLPVAAIKFCMEQARVSAADIDAIGYSYDPALRRQTFVPDHLSVEGDWGSVTGENTFWDSLDRVPHALSALLGRRVPIGWVRHHLAHAAAVYHPFCPRDAAVLVVDGIGENAASVLFGGDTERLNILEETCYPHSIGFVWERISAFLGFSPYDACKVMGLAAYGHPRAHRRAFKQFVQVNHDGTYALNLDVLRFRLPSSEPLEALLGPPRSGGPIAQRHADIAATLQELTDEIMLGLVRRLYDLHPSKALGLAGGVALNCSTNYVLKERGPFEQLYFPPAPHDGGTAIGAALQVAALNGDGGRAAHTPYLGPAYSDRDIANALQDSADAHYRTDNLDELVTEVTDLLCGGAVVAWFQGKMELGPRALGNRSLLADPRDPQMRELLNHKVKHREHFRPFAPSVLAEHAHEWFDLGRPSQALDLMLCAVPIREGLADRIPAVAHKDGTARVQLVHRESNPRYHALISKFYERTGVPMLLNTSFNDSEPIVCSPADALHTFSSTRIDALVLGDHIVRRQVAGELGDAA